jgi:hypothetical protein
MVGVLGGARRSLIGDFDAGWLFLLAGSALLSATVLVPAADDLARARWLRDAAMLQQDRQITRLENHSNYLDAVNRAEGPVVVSLAATQLNRAPADRRAFMLDASAPGEGTASVFGALEPAPVVVRPFALPATTLRAWATDRTTRLWLIAAGGLCVLVGLLPRAVGRGEKEEEGTPRAEGALG